MRYCMAAHVPMLRHMLCMVASRLVLLWLYCAHSIKGGRQGRTHRCHSHLDPCGQAFKLGLKPGGVMCMLVGWTVVLSVGFHIPWLVGGRAQVLLLALTGLLRCSGQHLQLACMYIVSFLVDVGVATLFV